MLFGIEASYINAMIRSLTEANQAMMDTRVEEAVTKSQVLHKGDTLGLDQRPENTITSELLDFDQYAILITEERGEGTNPLAADGPSSVQGARTFYGCDPCDRSSQLCAFLQDNKRMGERVSDILRNPKAISIWESKYGKPASITGANAAITCVRRGRPICSVILNYLTQQMTVACSAGIYTASLPKSKKVRVDLDYFREKGEPVIFLQPGAAHSKRVVTFVGKPERRYPQNFENSRMVAEHELKKSLYYDQPGGPTRILYLSTMQTEKKPVGFVMANGEKLGEWIHWLSFIMAAMQRKDASANAMCLYEVTQDESLMRDGYLMMPSPAYSIFEDIGNGKVVINVDHLRRLENPSMYRATLIVTPALNKWAMDRVEQYGYRKIVF
jgi:hypothetical protein